MCGLELETYGVTRRDSDFVYDSSCISSVRYREGWATAPLRVEQFWYVRGARRGLQCDLAPLRL